MTWRIDWSWKHVGWVVQGPWQGNAPWGTPGEVRWDDGHRLLEARVPSPPQRVVVLTLGSWVQTSTASKPWKHRYKAHLNPFKAQIFPIAQVTSDKNVHNSLNRLCQKSFTPLYWEWSIRVLTLFKSYKTIKIQTGASVWMLWYPVFEVRLILSPS